MTYITPDGQRMEGVDVEQRVKRKRRWIRWLVMLLVIAIAITFTYISCMSVTFPKVQLLTEYRSSLNKTGCSWNNTSRLDRLVQQFSSSRSSSRKPCEACYKRFPGAIIAGVQKCGTAALLVYLNLHPDVASVLSQASPEGNRATELQFFTVKYNKGLAWYREHMPCSYSNQLTVEKDPPYFYRPKCSERISLMDPATKIIFIIKDPVERAISSYTGRRAYKTFEQTITDETGKLKYGHIILKFSTYTKFIDPWIAQFGMNQIHFVDGHSFDNAPLEELQKLEQFLELQPYFKESMFWFNETKGKPCFYSPTDGTPLCLPDDKGRRHPDVSEDVIFQLRDHFRPLNEQFFAKINRTFQWGY